MPALPSSASRTRRLRATNSSVSVTSWSRGRGRSTAKVARVRPGVPDMTQMRSPRSTASSTSWVTNTMVIRSRSHRCRRKRCMATRVMASSAPNGSSMRSRRGRLTSTRAKAARCRMPPESSCGIGILGVGEPDRLEQPERAFADLGGDLVARPWAVEHVVERAQPREEHGRLEQHPALRTRSDDPVAVEKDITAVGPREPGQQVQQRGLAATGRPEQAQELALLDLQVESVQRSSGAARRERPGKVLRTPSMRTAAWLPGPSLVAPVLRACST